MFGVGVPYVAAFITNFLLLLTLPALVVGLAAFLIIRAVRKKRSPANK